MSSPERLNVHASGKRSRGRKLRDWALPLLWIAMIAFGGGNSLSSGHTYLWLGHALAIFHLSAHRLELINYVLRKTGHFSVYAVLSFLLFRAWRQTLDNDYSSRITALVPSWSARASVLAVLGTMLVASLDEFHQSLTSTRTAAVRDIVLDTFGGLFAQMILLVFLINRRRSSSSIQ